MWLRFDLCPLVSWLVVKVKMVKYVLNRLNVFTCFVFAGVKVCVCRCHPHWSDSSDAWTYLWTSHCHADSCTAWNDSRLLSLAGWLRHIVTVLMSCRVHTHAIRLQHISLPATQNKFLASFLHHILAAASSCFIAVLLLYFVVHVRAPLVQYIWPTSQLTVVLSGSISLRVRPYPRRFDMFTSLTKLARTAQL